MKDFVLVLPELFLVITLLAVLFGEISYYGEDIRLITATALVGLAAAFLQTLLTYRYPATQIFGGSISVDGFSLFFKVLFIVLAGLVVATGGGSREVPRERQAEYCALVLGSALVLCVAAESNDLILSFLSLQALSIFGFFLAGYSKQSTRSTEAAVKYMAFSAVSAALMLYGLSLLFAATHSLNLVEIHAALLASPLGRPQALAIFMLVFLSLAFQMAAFPMHLWAPDVLEGAPTPASAFLSVGSRAAAAAVLLRFVMMVFARPGVAKGQWLVLGALNWPEILTIISGTTMLAGALLALRQTSAKRMVGCLVIAQTGYLLIGAMVLDQVGIAALLYNLIVELFALIGCFAVLSQIFDDIQSDHLEDFKGLLWKSVPECICLVLFLLCLVGIPPLPGFIGKFALIGVAVRHEQPVLAIVAVATMVLSCVSVAKIAFSVIGSLPDQRAGASGVLGLGLPRARAALLASMVVPMVLVTLFANFFFEWAGRSLGFILW